MTRSLEQKHQYGLRWMATWSVPASIQITLSLWVAEQMTRGSTMLLFWIVVVAASLCVVAAAAVIARAVSTDQADLGSLGLLFFCASMLPLVHGITTPDVLFGPNSTTSASVLLSIPVGLLAVAPLVLPNESSWIRRRWKHWVLGSCTFVTALSGLLLLDINLLPEPQPRTAIPVVVAIVSFAGCVALSHRHLRLARISLSAAPLVVAFGYGLLGASAFVWLIAAPLTTGFWAAHGFDIGGVLIATIGSLIVYSRTGNVNSVLAPVLVSEPLRALEMGLDPLVHRYVAELEEKDPITRDHVVRTCELAMRVGGELRLEPTALRKVGLTAILHDVGKLEIPDEILSKPGRLNDDEFAIVRTHVEHGATLVAASPVLREVADGVRSHHERIDGAGYPNGIQGDDIPLSARIVAACDAFDAMANTRQYRDGMGCDRAIAVLQEHSGSQWDERAVQALITVVRRDPPAQLPTTLNQVGRTGECSPEPRMGCGCVPEALVASSS